ncbi:MAG: UDP-N-acetylglucosamine 4,6-dehydratase (inverting) [Alphaproteobacteria bacterium]
MSNPSYPIDIDLNGKSVLVTGGTGSFGNAFVETVMARYKPKKLVIFSRDEQKQYEMSQRWNLNTAPMIRYFIGDVRDGDRLDMAMRGIDIVIHAAALKHVPIAEYNPFECINTNVLGAQNVVKAAIQNNVRRVIALSTDKAANPVNLYGASKLAADKIFVAANNLSGHAPTRFALVRYGNVLGSRGSVVPLFRRLIAEGADHLPITDARMTRFWITLPQGVDFVLSCLGIMQGGEIFVPKIPSMKVTDLAAAMAPQLPQKVVGIRPGEKLHEVMITKEDSGQTIELTDRYIILPTFFYWSATAPEYPGSHPVTEGYEYSSDTNDDWIEGQRLHALLETLGG